MKRLLEGQLSIWSEEEMNVFAPKRKTKRELRQEAKEAFNRKLLERAVLSEEEVVKYNLPLKKIELIDFFNKNDWEIGKDYYMNKGVPQKVLTSLSKYSKKEQSDLLLSDLIIMYKSFDRAFTEKLGNTEFTKFRKANNLNSFGISQYLFMDKYVKELD
jgi:hypothetical protein